MRKLFASIALLLVATIGLAACSAPISTPIKVNADTVLIDVRTASEYTEGHLDGAINIDVQSPDFESRITELPANGEYIVYCLSGNRSAAATARMVELGLSNVTDAGGISDASASTGLAVVTSP